MEQGIHVRLESLTGEAQPACCSPQCGAAGTFYIETFGCQMNDHDSEKVAGVLLRRGYRQAASPADAHLVLYNTCSIRDKAEQKVFSRLGLFNPKNNLFDGNNKIIGVLGCVAQQEGERIFERAPWVSLVCGSASYSKLPVLLAQLEAGEPPRHRPGHRHGRDLRDGDDAARQSAARLRDHHRGLRQGLHLLRRAAHARPRDEAAPAPPS